MPDKVRMLEALAAAALVAAVVLLLCGLGRKRRPAWAASGAVLGVGLGFCVGGYWLGVRPHWPPREDQDRLLLILLPTVVVVEVIATAVGKWAWLLRGAVAATAPAKLSESTLGSVEEPAL